MRQLQLCWSNKTRIIITITCDPVILLSALPVPVLGEQVPLDALHEVLEPRGHARLLGRRLPLDDLVAQLLEVLRVEEDEAEEGPRHRPLVPAVLEHDDVEHRREHLLQDLRPQLDHLHQGVVVGHNLAAPHLA